MNSGRILIIGAPGSGKTTLADAIGTKFKVPVVHTDDYIDKVPFWAVPDLLIEIYGDYDKIVIEGVQAARLLTRDYNPDLVVYLDSDTTGGLATIARTRFELFQEDHPEKCITLAAKSFTIDEIVDFSLDTDK